MRTLRIAMLALGLAALAAGCGKKKDPAAPAADPATEPAEEAAPEGDPDEGADPCAGGEANPCG